MAIKALGCVVLVALVCVTAFAEEDKYSVPDPEIQVFSPKGFRATIPDHKDIEYFLVQGQLKRAGSDVKEDFRGGEAGSSIEVDGKKVWVVDLPEVELNKDDVIEYLAFVAVKNDGYIKDSLSHTVDEREAYVALPARPNHPSESHGEVEAADHQGSADDGQSVPDQN